MKIIPNIKYNGMLFKLEEIDRPLEIIYRNGEWFVNVVGALDICKAKTNIDHIVKSFKNGYWIKVKNKL